MAGAKICGLKSDEAVAAALAGRAAYLGFVFFDPSPRNLDPETAARLARPVRGAARIVAVTVDPGDELLGRIMAGLRPDLIQLHGRESPARAAEIGRRTGAGIIKALPVSEAADLQAAAAYEPVVEHLMFDARPPKGSALPGGVGASFDWSLMGGRRFSRPWFLAGGLDPWNVAEALAASGAPLADVSSGVERGAGIKDPALITSFLDAVGRA
jgi:phosphoribosylanthranilate isomerase